LIFVLILSGCASAPQEESAVTGEVVEGTEQEDASSDRPVKVDPNQKGEVIEDNGEYPTTTPDKDETETPAPDNTPSEENKQPEENKTPDEEGDEPSSDVNYKEADKLKIISYNIRYTDDPGGNSIDERQPRLKAVIDKYDPDLVGFQEATPRWITHIYNDYGAEYEIRYKYRAASNSESTPLMFKKDKFELLDEGYFWLSETPETESKGWGTELWRICNWVKLKVKATGKTVLYYNTHMGGEKDHHIGAANLILQRAESKGGFKNSAVFLTGDFNMTPWSPGYSVLMESAKFSDVNEDLNQDKSTTTNGYNEGEDKNGHIIDFCFYSPAKAVPLVYKVLNEKHFDGYVSDHRGLYIEVALT
jgi:endonuclease/exonuclease/phosphatase family metal-dependent hydrolase